ELLEAASLARRLRSRMLRRAAPAGRTPAPAWRALGKGRHDALAGWL
ncbi:MAG: hypothetical protein AVDCRST_MAG04-402, partial [uncultured Acetobacteraceae bacterium]